MFNFIRHLKANLDVMTIGLLLGSAAIYMVTHDSTCRYENQLDC